MTNKQPKSFLLVIPAAFLLIYILIESAKLVESKFQQVGKVEIKEKNLDNKTNKNNSASQTSSQIDQNSEDFTKDNLVISQKEKKSKLDTNEIREINNKKSDARFDSDDKERDSQPISKEMEASTRFLETELGIMDVKTGEIIRKELDSDGNLLDCTVGNLLNSRGLPACNEIVKERQKILQSIKEEKEKLELENDQIINKKLIGDNFFVLPNGSKIRIKTSLKYSDKVKILRDGAEIIINADIENIDATNQTFENIFIKPGSRIEISFLDFDNFELLEPVKIPLQIKLGQENNITYRKRIGSSSDDLVSIRLLARKPIKSLKEYLSIDKLKVSARFNK